MNTDETPKEPLAARKARHLDICVDPQAAIEGGDALFSQIRFIHHALPELAYDDLKTEVDFLGYRVALPFFISSMTGGSEAGFKANKDLARVAQAARVPVGMGSIRILFRQAELFDHFHLKKLAPDVPVVANLGAVQIRDMVHSEIVAMLRHLEVDALAIHLNPGQELFQDDGDRDFTQVFDAIRRFCGTCPIPVIVKETGNGIGAQEVVKLLGAGAAYVNVAGAGGTNWISVEAERAEAALRAAAAAFADWGNPTALVLASLRQMEDQGRLPYSTLQSRSVHQAQAIHAAETGVPRTRNKTRPAGFRGLLGGRVLASGGLRDGLDLAKSLALGAYMGGTALPLIRAVVADGFEGGLAYVDNLAKVLRNTMLLTGSPTVASLRHQPLLLGPNFQATIDQYVRAMGSL